MKTIGLIGGMSWESTVSYYRLINEGVREALGGLHSAEILMRSVDFGPVEELQREQRWPEAAEFLSRSALVLQGAGADLILICTNTMHVVADRVESAIEVPLIHIADAAGRELVQAGINKAGLLGTRFTMSKDFYRSRLKDKFGIEVLVPTAAGQKYVDSVIYNELCIGELRRESKIEFLRIIEDLANAGAEGIVLGCTEIPLLIGPGDADLPIFDTTELHAKAAVRAALGA
jgi:aspartate racemase